MVELADTMIYEDGKVYGPYTRDDNRMHVIIIFPDGQRKTVSYPRYLIELKQGKYLPEDAEVHHRDGDETNNSLDNLEVVHKTIHRMARGSGSEIWTCVNCGKEFEVSSLQASRRKSEQKRGRAKTGPFCSKSCNGKVNN